MRGREAEPNGCGFAQWNVKARASRHAACVTGLHKPSRMRRDARARRSDRGARCDDRRGLVRIDTADKHDMGVSRVERACPA